VTTHADDQVEVGAEPGHWFESEPLWFKRAVFYEIHTRGFFDSNDDGSGDLRGITEKLDYLQWLGVDCIWLLPMYASPLRDGGYDISSFADIHPDYGSVDDLAALLEAAHRRGIRVIADLVMNHTSVDHPWFQESRSSPDSPKRDWYVWSDTDECYADARIIFVDTESSNWTWDPVAGAYYWHRFFAHQPDLNYENPEVRDEMLAVLRFWLELGLDGFRLDAVPYLFEREGTNCENLLETHAYLKRVREEVDTLYPDRVLLAEANQWPSDVVHYFGDGDECHMAFHFPLMPRMFMALRREDATPIGEILEQTPSIPGNCQWGLFLRNHDELTLEMVTDDERDYMYAEYAKDPRMKLNLGIRRRLAPLLDHGRAEIELLTAILFSLPGSPVLYYGDEIGMGDNVWLGDRNGVRTPMQWSADRNAGFSRANPQRLYLPVIIDSEYHHQAVNVEAQQHNRHSMLWWVKRLIGLRKQYRAFGQGSLEFLLPENRKVLAFVRRFDDERILVLVNLSRFTQCAEVDLTDYEGMVPVELFGRQDFPAVGAAPYFFTLSPHAFYWFALERRGAEPVETTTTRELRVARSWTELLEGDATGLERVLPAYLASCRWFGAKSRRPASTQIAGDVPLTREPGGPRLTYVRLEYTEGEPELYQLPLAEARGEAADRIERERPEAVVARVRATEAPEVEAPGVLYDPSGEREFSEALFDAIVRRRRLRGRGFEVSGTTTRALRDLWNRADGVPEPAPLRAEQSNTSGLGATRTWFRGWTRGARATGWARASS